MLKQLDHIHNNYVDESLLTFSTQLEADNEIDVSEPVILAHCVITPSVPFEISYQEQSAHYMQPDTLAFLRPPKA